APMRQVSRNALGEFLRPRDQAHPVRSIFSVKLVLCGDREPSNRRGPVSVAHRGFGRVHENSEPPVFLHESATDLDGTDENAVDLIRVALSLGDLLGFSEGEVRTVEIT